MTASPPDSSGSEDALDVSLMQRTGQGDHEAFAQLVERHQNAVVGTVAKMLGRSDDAEDIAQQVFLRLWKSAPRYKPTAKFTTFLFTIARNLVFNETRRRKRRKEYSLDEQEDEWNQTLAAPSSEAPDESAKHEELKKAVDDAIGSLPEKQRLAVILRRYEHMSYDDIAATLDLSVSAVKSQLFRARTTLREALESFLED